MMNEPTRLTSAPCLHPITLLSLASRQWMSSVLKCYYRFAEERSFHRVAVSQPTKQEMMGTKTRTKWLQRERERERARARERERIFPLRCRSFEIFWTS